MTQLSTQVSSAFASAASYVALVTQNNPYGSAATLLARPDIEAVLAEAVYTGRAAALAAVEQAWDANGAEETPVLAYLLADVNRAYDSLTTLRTAIRQAHASVPPRHFIPGQTTPGTVPSREAAIERAAAVRAAIVEFARRLSLRNELSADVAGTAGQSAAVLEDAYVREEPSEQLRKRWRAHVESETCCYWCRKLNGVTIALNASFIPYIGGPAALSASGHLTQPPRPYHGALQGPGLHPRCRCWLEIVPKEAPAPPADVSPSGSPGRRPPAPQRPGAAFISSAEIRAMPEERYRSMLAFLKAATHELGMLLRRLAGQ